MLAPSCCYFRVRLRFKIAYLLRGVDYVFAVPLHAFFSNNSLYTVSFFKTPRKNWVCLKHWLYRF